MKAYGVTHSLDVFFGLSDVARKFDVSIKEVEETMLRVGLRKLGAIKTCKHVPGDIIVRRDKTRPHCKKCWTWMDMLGRPGGNYAGEFKPIPSKLEEYLEKNLHLTLEGEDLQ